ncbi:MBL fold metallo-hydrolase [Clostridium oryzae]|uniref:Metallo-beta-lactamase superfamily protein n=1 Tax=Clostridium oryzae TaxID=1450648 RepID=A0A1V4I997_9CLOT|nr:MBL fold metallo-hydrolase [Clostridium oryzae]OPJ56568.1 metallo-beta-lactamase superfamily protein [Clostridium oryzae]
MKVTMLIEDEPSKDVINLANEMGLSMHFQFNDKNILFDAGLTEAFIDNARKMGINLKNDDFIVISHGHISHAGGLLKYLRSNEKAEIVISESAVQKHYIKICRNEIDISVPSEITSRCGNRIRYLNDFTEITKDVFIASNFIKKYPWVRFNQYMFTEKYGSFIRDDFKHELIMVINNAGKLVIVTGCSHNGITNIIESVKLKFPDTPIQAVIGGFHISGIPGGNVFRESEQSVRKLGQTLLSYNIDKVYTCHCTGMLQYNILKKVMKDKIEYFSTGREIEL